MPKKVGFIQVALAERCMCKGDGRQHSHLTAVDGEGRIWERFSDMPPGQWGRVEPPAEMAHASKRRGRKR